ncbi:hypothetical protein A3C17_01500 [Candidatus Uhrbacteria bacterium RIFCSPHIGHO2_02_FULL_53_13]|uniref:Type 4 fimbrial biogenesis protein PilX N-terminal domain-containing protein n=2 Tax=Candidatus Uhriibacteriota TaxID=1752732 RepID=A0A1F7TVM0_9BACT|nr:MAG: hypothetical protein A3C17_01500 [Candidatus Uhrbacteria bacterium RIFCSPHIGHO2_02_FULL_53_13]OGL89458.1 MAG: hypothetical protein A3I45_02025 [Candidatus Uhrbacteria bacterium RIFCSPLOWO2_02_FULL_53_10]
MTLRSDQRGVALFLTVLVMGTVAVAVLIGLTQQSVNAIVDARNAIDALHARETAFGCLDEAMIQLVGDGSWSSASVTLPDSICTVTLAIGSTIDVLVTATSGKVTRGVKANITLDPFTINDVQEALSL